MFYRENGQFKTSYKADQQAFAIPQDRWAIVALVVFAFIGVPLLVDEYMFRAILVPLPGIRRRILPCIRRWRVLTALLPGFLRSVFAAVGRARVLILRCVLGAVLIL